MSVIKWSAQKGKAYRDGMNFDPWRWIWQVAEESPDDAMEVAVEDAFRLTMAQGARQVPVGVIGPKEANADQLRTAEDLGAALAGLHVQMLCGGRGGVMEAACRGNLRAGGRPIGLLPDEEWQTANDFVAIPIATGIGSARNAIIARSCPVLIAVGGGYGTLSEIAYGLHFDRLVLTLSGAPAVEGAVKCADISEAVRRLAAHILRLDET